MSLRKKRTAVGLGVVVLVAAMAVASLASGAGARNVSTTALPRTSTLYTTGKQWGPYASFNPLRNERSTGTLGLLYETLFRYDPLANKFIPWLATNGKWVGRSYVLTLRSGVKWNDGKPLTAADVKFTFETGKLEGSEHSTMWKTGLTSITSKGNVVSFNFKGVPNYQDWDNNMYSIPIVPKHIWQSYSATDITTGNVADPSKMVGTGPFTYGGGAGSSATLQWNRRAGWWATKALGKKMAMKYIVDINNGSNASTLQNFQQDHIDLSNNFFPGIDKLLTGGKYSSYYKSAPYMLSANTAWLVPNTTHKPLNDPAFRRALAESINIDQIVSDDYGHIVSKANATGLLPSWNNVVDQAQVKKLGFKYNIAKAKADLAAAGYKTGSDGYVLNKDGSKINLDLIVPNGWSDWMTAIQIIAASAKNAGIKITPGYPSYDGLVSQRSAGTYDLVIANDKQMSNSPYSYYDYIFHLPIADQQTFANYARFTEAGATPWALTLKLNKLKSSDPKYKALNSKIQKFILEDLPIIPLWYNGMWSQYNTTYWTNFPSSTAKGLQFTPTMWNGFLEMTGIDMLANLKKK